MAQHRDELLNRETVDTLSATPSKRTGLVCWKYKP